MNHQKRKLLVIAGPTAVGKTMCSMDIANAYRGEIISADSTQVYRGMDIGTAKASAEERSQIQHHLIDILDPGVPFSVQMFQQLATKKIEEIQERNSLPLIVGGTGLYIESVTHGYLMPTVPENKQLREQLNQLADIKGNAYVHEQLERVDSVTSKKLHCNDLKRIIRALEVFEATKLPLSAIIKKSPSAYDLLWIGLTMPREQLYQRINDRVDRMVEEGLVQEIVSLKEKGYHRDLTSMQAIGYKEIMSYLGGEISLDASIELIKKGTRRYAKRQLTWFRRIPEMHWFDVTQAGVFEEIGRLVEGKFFRQKE